MYLKVWGYSTKTAFLSSIALQEDILGLTHSKCQCSTAVFNLPAVFRASPSEASLGFTARCFKQISGKKLCHNTESSVLCFHA